MMQNQKTSDAMLFHDYQGYGHGCSYIEVAFIISENISSASLHADEKFQYFSCFGFMM